MKMLDNINSTVRDDLQQSIRKGSKISIAAACFSIYAYQELADVYSRENAEGEARILYSEAKPRAQSVWNRIRSEAPQ